MNDSICANICHLLVAATQLLLLLLLLRLRDAEVTAIQPGL